MAAIATQCTLVAIVTIVLWKVYRRLYRASPLDNIPGPPPSGSWLTGHAKKLFHREGWQFHYEMYDYGHVVRLDGIFGQPLLFVYDPVALHNIVVKDQQIFEETSAFLAMNELIFGKGLLATLGDQHKKQRKILNPVFSINHMRHMLPIFYKVTDRLRDAIASQVTSGPRTIDMAHWMVRVALELVGQGGLGCSFDALTDDTPNAFGEAIKQLGPIIFPVRHLLTITRKIGTPGFRRWVGERIPHWRARKARELIDTLHTVSCEIVNSKKAALAKGDEEVIHQVGEGKDIISKLLQANMVASAEDRLSDEEVVAQVSTLVSAAMDTTSGVLSHLLHLLADHPDVQERLRKEVIGARQEADGGHISYDRLVELPYLDAVCRETLRLYPPLPGIGKTYVRHVVLPLGKPLRGRDGTLMHELLIPKNTNIAIGILASNRNPELWGPDADEWKPERWLSPLPETLINAHIPGVYSNLMTFLGGGRSCIGFKFSQMEMKVVLATLLESFTFSIPLELEEPIYWNLAGIQFPTVGKISTKPELPLRVELLREGGE
ncbi:cytochrome P450 [Daedaleopsis nitida]|nr:cytochrome P450 [Daedaleopsis nitida]